LKKGNYLSTLKPEGSLLSVAFNQIVGPRRSNNEVQHKQSHKAQSDSTRCYVTHARKEKLHERPRSFPPLNYLDILLPPRSMCPLSFLVLPTSLCKSREEISFRGGRVVTPHVMKILIKLLKMQLSLKARGNQVVEVSNQNLNYQDFKFEVSKCYLVWIDILSQQIFRIDRS
jgi:hypothetical protein